MATMSVQPPIIEGGSEISSWARSSGCNSNARSDFESALSATPSNSRTVENNY